MLSPRLLFEKLKISAVDWAATIKPIAVPLYHICKEVCHNIGGRSQGSARIYPNSRLPSYSEPVDPFCSTTFIADSCQCEHRIPESIPESTKHGHLLYLRQHLKCFVPSVYYLSHQRLSFLCPKWLNNARSRESPALAQDTSVSLPPCTSSNSIRSAYMCCNRVEEPTHQSHGRRLQRSQNTSLELSRAAHFRTRTLGRNSICAGQESVLQS